MKESYVQRPDEIEVHPIGGTKTDVIIRRNITEVENAETLDGAAYTSFECEEKQFRYDGVLTKESIAAKVDYWWSYADGESMDVVDRAKAEAINRMSQECHAAITAGVDVELSDGTTEHFDLSYEDQINLITLSSLAASQDSVPYHSAGMACRYFSAADVSAIVAAATRHKTYHTTYYNSLRDWINAQTDLGGVTAIHYGDAIPEEYQSEVLKTLFASAEAAQ